MFCSKCNKKIKPGSNICDKCGEAIVLEEVTGLNYNASDEENIVIPEENENVEIIQEAENTVCQETEDNTVINETENNQVSDESGKGDVTSESGSTERASDTDKKRTIDFKEIFSGLSAKLKKLTPAMSPLLLPLIICVSVVLVSSIVMVISYNSRQQTLTQTTQSEPSQQEAQKARDIVSNKDEADKYMKAKGYTNLDTDFSYGIDGSKHIYTQNLSGLEVYGKGIVIHTNDKDEVTDFDISNYIKTFDKTDEKKVASLLKNYEKDRETIIKTFKEDIRKNLKENYKSDIEMSEPYLCIYCGNEPGVKKGLVLGLVAEVEAFKKDESMISDTFVYLCDTSNGKFILPEKQPDTTEKTDASTEKKPAQKTEAPKNSKKSN